jgi:uncharacterized SAM-binding protein YcdF (DUF218 family)
MSSSTTPIPGSGRRAVGLRRAMVLCASVILLGAAAWFAREPLLRSAADLWIVSDQVGPADAVAIFGGGLEQRPFAAAAYYRQGLVTKILVTNIDSSPAERLGVLQSHVEANRRVLLKLGVPDAAIETIGNNLSNTYEEAVALRSWAERTGAPTVIVPTEIFSARRVRWTLTRVFAGGAAVRVPAIDPIGYRRDDWWKRESGLIGFQNEIMKYIYYRFKY